MCLSTDITRKNPQRLHIDALPLPQSPLRWALTVSKATCREESERARVNEREREKGERGLTAGREKQRSKNKIKCRQQDGALDSLPPNVSGTCCASRLCAFSCSNMTQWMNGSICIFAMTIYGYLFIFKVILFPCNSTCSSSECVDPRETREAKKIYIAQKNKTITEQNGDE